MMITLYLVRHGQCSSNTGNAFQGQIDSPLTELGIRQAHAIADKLASVDFTVIYASDLIRTRITADIIASRHQLPVQTTPLVRECSLGAVQGMTEAEFAERYPEEFRLWRKDPITCRPPGAETFGRVMERCQEFIDQILANHGDGEKIAVAVHIGSVSGLICAALRLPVHAYTGIHVSNASLSILEIGDHPTLRMLNDTCHLASLTSV